MTPKSYFFPLFFPFIFFALPWPEAPLSGGGTKRGDKEMPTKKYRVSSDVVYIRINEIRVPEWARKISREYLEESIKTRGVITPIVVGRVRRDREAEFILIDGHGRLEIAREMGLEEVPARIVDVQSEEEALLLSLELEQTREPWSLEYTIQVINSLLAMGYSKTDISRLLKIPRTKLYRLLWISEFPEEIRQAFLQGYLPLRAAEKIKEIIDNLEDERDLVKFFEELLVDPSTWEKVCNSWKMYVEGKVEMPIEKEEEEEEEEEEIEEEEIPEITPPPVTPAPSIPETAAEEEVVPVEVPERPREAPEELPGLREIEALETAVRFIRMLGDRKFECDPLTFSDVNTLVSTIQRAHYIAQKLLDYENLSNELKNDLQRIVMVLDGLQEIVKKWEFSVASEEPASGEETEEEEKEETREEKGEEGIDWKARLLEKVPGLQEYADKIEVKLVKENWILYECDVSRRALADIKYMCQSAGLRVFTGINVVEYHRGQKIVFSRQLGVRKDTLL